MGLFRRKQETLNERLLREAGLESPEELDEPSAPLEPEPELPATRKPWQPRMLPTEDYLLSRTDEIDAVVTVKARLPGDRIEFITLPNGDIIVATEDGDEDLSPLADALEKKVHPPYKAFASRHSDEVWAVGAKRLQVAKVELPEGDAIELTERDGGREVRVDGKWSDAAVPELVELGAQAGPDYCVEAERIDGDFWEVKVSPL